MSLHFLDDVFLLHFALETPQGILQRLTLLQSNFRQIRYTPKLVPLGPYKLISNLLLQVKKNERSFLCLLSKYSAVPESWHGFRT